MATRRKNSTHSEVIRPIRRRHGPSTEGKILTAAEKLFAIYGFDAVSTKQLAKEAGVAIGALYHHFPSKEAIYAAATTRAFANKSTPPQEVMASNAPPERKLAELVAWFVRPMILDKNYSLLLKREMLDPRPSTSHFTDLFRESLDMFKELIRQVEPDANLDAAVAAMLALIYGFANLKGIDTLFPDARKTVETPEEIAAYSVHLLLRGLRP